jgi:cellulose synthase operon protein C
MSRFLLFFFLVGSLPLWAAPTEAELFSEAESRYLGKSYTAALEAYDALLSAYPLSDLAADVQYRRAVCMYRLERYRDAARLLEQVGTRYRSTRYRDYVPFWKGLCQYQQAAYSQAEKSLREFLDSIQDPELTPQALLYLALSRVGLKDYPGAGEPLQTVVRTYRAADVFPYSTVLLGSLLKKQKDFEGLLVMSGGVDPAAFPLTWKERFLLNRADALWETGKADEAEALYRPLADSAQPDVALGAFKRLVAAAQKRKDLQGMQDLTRAAEARFASSPDLLAELWSRIGLESYRQGSLAASELFLQRVWDQRKKQPVNEAVPLYLAEVLLARRDTAAARSLLEEYAAGAGAASESAAMRLGDIALQTGDYAAADRLYGRFAGTFPGSPRLIEAGYYQGYALYRQGKTGDSLQLVARLLPQADGSYRTELRRLRIAVLRKTGDMAAASEELAAFCRDNPRDSRAAVDLLSVLFQAREYARLLREADALGARLPALASMDPRSGLLLSYYRGLALIAAKEYPEAAAALAAVTQPAAQAAGLEAIHPYAGYYLGWAYVKNGSFDKAAAILDGLFSSYPRHELADKVLFLSGWCRFSLGDFDRSSGLFSQAARQSASAELAARAVYLAAKSMLNLGRLAQAAEALQKILNSTPPSPFADSAQFDYASVLDRTGAAAAAADTYLALATARPDSPLAEEAMYRRAEVYQTHGMQADARAAFTEYRRRFPKGRLLDAALYWGGEASYAAGEKFAGVLLWEQLAAGFPGSAFRAAAIRKTAEVYRDSRDFSRALALYSQLLSEYPEEARAAKADIAADQVRYQLQGFGDKEADLTTRISSSRGAVKAAAMVELARMYILAGDPKAEQGFQLLPQITALGDPASSFQAQYLAGEYFYRRGDLAEASKRFLAAAVTGSATPEFAASAIFRAAEMMKLAGRQEEAKALVKRLQDNFPSSPWSARGRALLEAQR